MAHLTLLLTYWLTFRLADGPLDATIGVHGKRKNPVGCQGIPCITEDLLISLDLARFTRYIALWCVHTLLIVFIVH